MKNENHTKRREKYKLFNDPEGWYGEGGGRGVQDGEHSVYLWQIHVDV